MTTQSDRTVTDRGGSDLAAATAEVPHLFLTLRCNDLHAAPSRHALSHVDEVHIGRGDTFTVKRTVASGMRTLELRVPDPRMSRAHARLHRVPQGFELHDAGSTNGSRVDGAPVQSAALRDGALLEFGSTFLRLRAALPTPAQAAGDLLGDRFGDRPRALCTLLPELDLAFERLARIARSDVPILLLGETGTGKEWLARAVAELSARSGAFVALNCGALPEALVSSLLFGHVRGAFSGATRDEPGHVRSAHGGTLFLDEVGDLPAGQQAALLRVLQENEVVPVGATRPVPVDVRFVSATHAPLPELAERGGFRADLYARLAGFAFTAPPLRARMEDLGLIVRALAPELEQAAGAPLSLQPEAARLLLAYDWPRNLRELHKALLAAAVLAGGKAIAPEHLPEALRARGPSAQARRTAPGSDDALREELLRLLAEHDGNVTQVARALGKARFQVQRWIKRFGIDATRYR